MEIFFQYFISAADKEQKEEIKKIQANVSYMFSFPLYIRGRDSLVKIIQNCLEVSLLLAKNCWLSHIPQIKSMPQA